MAIFVQLKKDIDKEASSFTFGLHVLQSVISVILLIWATLIIGFALPAEHGYHGGWIFGLAWFPIILYAVFNLVVIGIRPKRLFPSVISFILPYLFIGINLFWSVNATLDSFIVQSALLQYAGVMVGYTLQMVVYPMMATPVGKRSSFIHEQAIPQIFVISLGFVLCGFAFSFLIKESIITLRDLPMIFIGIIQSGISLNFAIRNYQND